MDALEKVRIGMTAEKTVTVTCEMTVGHFVTHMPQVYATPMMILHMEMASGVAIASHLPAGFVSVGMDVKVRHLAATPVGHVVRAISRVIQIDAKSVVFEVEAWDGDRKIGDGTHRRGIVNLEEFEKRFGVRPPTMSLLEPASVSKAGSSSRRAPPATLCRDRSHSADRPESPVSPREEWLRKGPPQFTCAD